MGLKPRAKPATQPFAEILARYTDEIWKLDSSAQLDRLLETIELCPNASALWQLMTTEDLSYTTMTADGGLDSAITEKIFALVASWQPEERARGLDVVGLLTTLSLAHTLTAGSLERVKVAEFGTLDANIAAIRRWCKHPNRRLREAAVMLLCRAPAAGSSDLVMLGSILRDGEPDSLRAAATLATGILAHRRDANRRAALAYESTIEENLTCASPLLACTSAVALALVRGKLCDVTAPRLVEAFDSRHPLPDTWGAYDDERTTGGLSRAAMLRLPGPGKLLASLIDTASAEPEQDLLMRIGFGCEQIHMENRGSAAEYKPGYSEVPAGGLARNEMEEHQERILDILMGRRTAWHLCAPLGFFDLAAEVPAFLAGDGPRWRAVAVTDASGSERRWHVPLLWRRFVFGPLVARDRAVQAMLDALPCKTLLNVILNWDDRRVIEHCLPSRAERKRDKQLFTATMKAMRARGYDVRGNIRERIANPRLRLVYEPAAVGLCLRAACKLDGVATPADPRSSEVLGAAAKMFGKA